MRRRNDAPTSQRMGFGPREALSSGLSMPPERTAKAINAERVVESVVSMTLNYNRFGLNAHLADPKVRALALARKGHKANRIVELLRAEADEVRDQKSRAWFAAQALRTSN